MKQGSWFSRAQEGRRSGRRWAWAPAAGLVFGLALAGGAPARAEVVRLTTPALQGKHPQINNRGQVVWLSQVDGRWTIELWDNGTTRPVAQVASMFVRPMINDLGQVIWADDGVYVWDGSAIRHVHTAPGGSILLTINRIGAAAWIENSQVYLWDGQTIQQVSAGSIQNAVPRIDLNDRNQVVWTGHESSGYYVYFWDGTSLRRLGSGPPAPDLPHINDAGQIIWCTAGSGSVTLYRWQNGNLQSVSAADLYFPQINEAGQVVGTDVSMPAHHISLWDGGAVQSLANYDALTPIDLLSFTSAMMTLTEPQINDAGQVVWQRWDGQTRAVYLWDGRAVRQIGGNAKNNLIPQINNAGQVVWQSMPASVPPGYESIDDTDPTDIYLYTPARPGSLDLSDGSVTGGHSITATVTLSAPAPTGGTQLTLTSDDPAATVPPTLTLPAGQTTAAFTVTTTPVATTTAVTLTAAAADGFTASATLSLLPPALADLSLDLVSLIGGAPTSGTVSLADPAPQGGLSLPLASADPAATVPPQVTVPAGQTTAAFIITTRPVTARTPVTISVTAGGLTRSATVTLLPAVAAAAPALVLQPKQLFFGSQPVGRAAAAQTLTLTNSGTAPLLIEASHLEGDDASDFSVPDLAGTTLAPGESRTVAVQFTPSGRGNRSATLVLTDTAPGSPHRVPLEGGGLAPAARFSPSALAFGAEPVGLTGTLGLLVQNIGEGPLTVSGISFQGANAGDFSLATDGLTGQSLQPGEIALLNIHFTPTAAGARSATLVLADDAPDSPQSVALTGTGTAPLLQLSAGSLLFGLQSSGTQSVTLTNNGDAPLRIDALTLGGPDAGHFKIVSDTGEQNLAVGGSRTVQIAFQTATVAGVPRHGTAHIAAIGYSATLEIQDNDPHPTSLHSVALIAGSTAANGGTTPASPPAAPGALTALTATVVAGPQVQLTWTNPQPDPHAYVTLWRQAGSGNWSRVALLPGDATTFTDTSVSANASYSYQAHWVNGPAVSPWSNLAHASTAGMSLAPPSGLTATVGSGPQVRLIWSLPAPNPHAYLTLWRQAGAGEWTRVALLRGDATRFTDTSVQPGTSYSYHAHLVNDPAVSAWSNTATVSTPTAGPAQLSATAGPGGRVVLTWRNPQPDARAWVTVWRQAGSGEWTRVALLHGDATTFTDTSVQSGTSYRYRAHRVDGADVSDWSNEAAVLP